VCGVEAQASKGAVTDGPGAKLDTRQQSTAEVLYNFRQEVKPRSRAIMNRA